jgi:cobalamin biosynthesis Mg chelatase CobN
MYLSYLEPLDNNNKDILNASSYDLGKSLLNLLEQMKAKGLIELETENV